MSIFFVDIKNFFSVTSFYLLRIFVKDFGRNRKEQEGKARQGKAR